MDARELFLLLHGRLPDMTERLLVGLTDEEIRRRPRPGANSVAWLLWHMARCEDVGVNGLVAERPQLLLTSESWSRDLNVDLRDIATGMADREVAVFSDRVNVAGLRAYWAEVGRTTRDLVLCLRPEVLDEVVSSPALQRIVVDGAFGAGGEWVNRHFQGRTKGWLLGQLALRHHYVHFAEASLVRGLVEAGR
jgi:DinB superfamily